jgi:hypothetical protein
MLTLRRIWGRLTSIFLKETFQKNPSIDFSGLFRDAYEASGAIGGFSQFDELVLASRPRDHCAAVVDVLCELFFECDSRLLCVSRYKESRMVSHFRGIWIRLIGPGSSPRCRIINLSLVRSRRPHRSGMILRRYLSIEDVASLSPHQIIFTEISPKSERSFHRRYAMTARVIILLHWVQAFRFLKVSSLISCGDDFHEC